MSGDSTELRNAAKIICPYNGWVYGLYGSGAATATDLSTLGYPLTGAYGGNAPDPGNLSDIMANMQSTSNIDFTGLLGKYARLTAYGANFWIVNGAGSAAVSAGNAPVIPTGTANLSGVGVPEPIFQNTWVDLFVSVNTRWLGAISSASGSGVFLMIRPSSVGGNG
jgi:hypothetical protein